MNKKIYLIYGLERHLIDSKIEEIINSFFDNEKKNIVKYDLLEQNVDDAIEDLMTVSLFENKKIIICENSMFLTSNNTDQDLKQLTKLFDNSIDNIIIFKLYEEKLDDRKKIVKEFKNKANLIFFPKLKRYELKKYIEDSFIKDKYSIDKQNVDLIIDMVGENLDLIVSEIEKLKMCNFDEREISFEDIDNLCFKKTNENIFDLVDSVISRDVERSLGLYEDLLINNEDPVKMIALIATQFRLGYQTKIMLKDGYSELEISKHLEVHPYRVKLANEIRTDESILLFYLKKLADLDLKIKTGEVDKNIAFEMFLMEI